MAHATQLEMKESIIVITLVHADGLQESTCQHMHPLTGQAQSRIVETGARSNVS